MKHSSFRTFFLAALFLVFGFTITATNAQSTKSIADEMKQKVVSGIEEYRQLEANIAVEKEPLVEKLLKLEDENLQKRTLVENYRLQANTAKSDIEEQGQKLKDLQIQNEYILSALDDYLAKFDSRLNVSESQVYLNLLAEPRETTQSENSSIKEKYSSYTQALNLGFDRIEKIIGGHSFSGQAIDPKGKVHDGTIAIVGPIGYFASEADDSSGILQFNNGTIQPRVLFFNPVNEGPLNQFIDNSKGMVPLDPTLGDAITLQAAHGTWTDHLQKGGIVGYVILLLGIIALFLTLFKIGDLRSLPKSSSDSFVELARMASKGDVDKALSKASKIPGVSGQLLENGIRNIKASSLFLEESMLSVILRNKPKMERFLPYLAITAAATPLLGLLGTVVGLIKTFALITLYGTGTPKALSSGISEALITTELGLVIAIPTLIIHGLLSRIVKSRVESLEQSVFDFVNNAKEEINRD